MAFPITFNNEHYDLNINFNWMHPVFTDWAYEQWGYLEVVLLPPVKVKVDIKAVCSVVGYTIDYIPTKDIQNLDVIPGECWDLNRQFQEYLPPSPTDLHISILYHNDDDQPLYIVKPRVPQIPCPTWTFLLHDSSFPSPFPRIHYPLHFPSAVFQHWVGTQLAIASSHLNMHSITTSFCTFSSNHILVQLLAWGGLYGV